jgi:hypothetical protein
MMPMGHRIPRPGTHVFSRGTHHYQDLLHQQSRYVLWSLYNGNWRSIANALDPDCKSLQVTVAAFVNGVRSVPRKTD